MEKILPFTELDRFLLQQNVLLLQQLLSFVFFVIAEKTRVLAHLRRTCRKGREMANARESVSKFGKFLSSMVMPNIGAFIAWGFMTAMFIPTGWFPNKTLAAIASPMLTYLIPILIASQGGYLIAGKRGRIIATIAVMGAIVSGITVDPVTGETTVTTMLMASMLVGPAAGWLIKKFDQLIEGHTPAGFEMLIDNFSLGIGGLVLAIVAYLVIGPLMLGILAVLQAGVQVLMQYSLMPLLAIFIEPAKVLFLNNAINHGIFTPIGLEQVANTGRSLMFLLEANPGPGLGVLLAYCFFCKDETTRQSAPGAVIIHFLGGIHEIYFPYVLMNPTVIIAPIVGNAAAILWFSLAGGGLVAPASPGSVIAILSMTPQGSVITTLVGIALAAGVSFAIASPIVARAEIKSLDEAKDEMGALKGRQTVATDVDKKFGQHVVFACDAGMGSSAMGATRFHNRIKLDRPDIVVTHASVDEVPADTDIVVVQKSLAGRAQKSAPDAQFIIINNFLSDPALDGLYDALVATEVESGVGETDIEKATEKIESRERAVAIDRDGIKLDCPSVTREGAIRASGQLLVEHGAVDPSYVDAMLERDREQSVYMGMGVAIPHGTNEAKGSVKKTCVTLHQYPGGVLWGDEKAYLVFGIAGTGDEHLQVLANVAKALEDESVIEKMRTTTDVDWLLSVLG